MQSHELGFFLTKKRRKKKAQQVENDQFVSSQKFDFMVDEGKERLNPSCEKKIKTSTAEGRWKRNPASPSSCVTPAGTSTSQTSRINGKKTQQHTPAGKTLPHSFTPKLGFGGRGHDEVDLMNRRGRLTSRLSRAPCGELYVRGA